MDTCFPFLHGLFSGGNGSRRVLSCTMKWDKGDQILQGGPYISAMDGPYISAMDGLVTGLLL